MFIYHRPLKNGTIQEFVFELDRNKFELISPIDVNFRFTVYEKFIVFDINTLNKSNQGYGTALISIVLEYAKENKFDFVAGHLARADFENGNWKKSIDFYLHRLSTAFLIKSDLFMRDLYPQYENTQDFFDSQTHYYSYDNFIKEFSEGYIIYPMA